MKDFGAHRAPLQRGGEGFHTNSLAPEARRLQGLKAHLIPCAVPAGLPPRRDMCRPALPTVMDNIAY
jgi:hypothetical protein